MFAFRFIKTLCIGSALTIAATTVSFSQVIIQKPEGSNQRELSNPFPVDDDPYIPTTPPPPKLSGFTFDARAFFTDSPSFGGPVITQTDDLNNLKLYLGFGTTNPPVDKNGEPYNNNFIDQTFAIGSFSVKPTVNAWTNFTASGSLTDSLSDVVVNALNNGGVKVYIGPAAGNYQRKYFYDTNFVSTLTFFSSTSSSVPEPGAVASLAAFGVVASGLFLGLKKRSRN